MKMVKRDTLLKEDEGPEDYERMKISIKLQRITFTLCNDSPSAQMISNKIEGMQLDVIMRPTSMWVHL